MRGILSEGVTESVFTWVERKEKKIEREHKKKKNTFFFFFFSALPNLTRPSSFFLQSHMLMKTVGSQVVRRKQRHTAWKSPFCLYFSPLTSFFFSVCLLLFFFSTSLSHPYTHITLLCWTFCCCCCCSISEHIHKHTSAKNKELKFVGSKAPPSDLFFFFCCCCCCCWCCFVVVVVFFFCVHKKKSEGSFPPLPPSLLWSLLQSSFFASTVFLSFCLFVYRRNNCQHVYCTLFFFFSGFR